MRPDTYVITASTLAWLLMTVLAIAVAAYAGTMLLAPDLRVPIVRGLLAERPVAAIIHFAGGSTALVAGALQLNSRLRSRFIDAHRWLGRLYVLAIVMGGTAGFVLALHSSGGVVARAGFTLLAVCWLVTTLNGYRYIRKGDRASHRRWMIRSYALTLAAVTLRVYLPLSQLVEVSFEVAYPAIAWLCWVPNLLIAEWIVRSRRDVQLTQST